ncbi:hypothetical protein MD484_g4665, partial [Candolleomyces efflorescens]
MGNTKSNGIYNPNELRNPPPPNLEDGERDSEMEQYIRAKYEYRKYMDRNALVASKLGPSRSSTSMPRSASSPLTTNARSSTLPSSSTATSSKPSSSPLANSQPVSQKPAIPASKLSVQPRSVSQPVPPQNPPQANPVSQGGVWDDLIQLQDKPTSSTLPLQYQQQSAASTLSIGLSGPTGLTQGPLLTGSPMATPPVGLGINPFQQLQLQPQLATTPSFAPSASPFTPSLPLNQNLQLSTPSYGQQLFMNQTGMATGTPQSSQFYQPQPQTASLPLQTPTPQGFLTPSPSLGMMSAPVTQTQFMTPSPSQQFLSHSPQPQFQAQPTGQPQQMFMTPSPQPTMGMGVQSSYSPGPGMMAGQWGVGGMATQQTQFQMQQPQQQQQGQFLQGLPDQMLSPANFQAAGGRNPFAPQHRGTF